MDIAEIHVGSFATNVAQVAAAQIAGLLHGLEWDASDHDNWFDPASDLGAAATVVEQLGEYVIARQTPQGETLYRFALGRSLIADQGPYASLAYARRQPWETFVATCRAVHADLMAAQLATIEARRQARSEAPVSTIKREDSIFEEEDKLGDLIPEAVEALRLSGTYQRTHGPALDEARAKLAQQISDRAKFNGADPAKFDHDGDGKAGGARPQPLPGGSGPGQPLSVGEAPVKPPVNRGGRGRKKAD